MAEQGKTISTFLIPKDETTREQSLKNIPCTAEDNPQVRSILTLCLP